MIWFDLDNSPHIPVFRPIFKELTKRNQEYIITARDFAQTKELLKLWQIEGRVVGKHGGKHKISKLINLFHRGLQLKRNVRKMDITLAVSHGSRTQLIASFLSNIKAIWLLDYEYTEISFANQLASFILMPAYIPEKRLNQAGFNLKKIIKYHGFKEELYLNDFLPDCTFRSKLNISEDSILIIIRPPSMVANYHNSKSEELLISAIKHFTSVENTVCLVVSRTVEDRNFILSKIQKSEKVRFLDNPVDGLQLLFSADIAISGGGTMNRESALLGTETYSIFTGRRPYLDELLSEQKRLNFISQSTDLDKIVVERKKKKIPIFSNKLVTEISDIILNLNNY